MVSRQRAILSIVLAVAFAAVNPVAAQEIVDKTLATDLVQLNRMLTRIKKDPISEK